jgi:hypothetical protein
MLGKRSIINVPPGVNKEDNSLTSFLYSNADKIRFYQQLPEKIGGWKENVPENNQVITGVPRTLFSFIDFSNLEHLLVGTHTGLYVSQLGNIYNITPLDSATTAIANSLATNYIASFAGNAIATFAVGSPVVIVTFAPLLAPIFQVGDIIQISGSGAIGGIIAGNINGNHSISAITSTTFSFVANTNALSIASGGIGATLTTRVVTVSQVAHGYDDGDRIKITMAANMGGGTGGFTAADLNIESWVREIDDNTWAYYLNGTAIFADASAVNRGGAATLVQHQIAAGFCTVPNGLGYGGGAYGKGKYGVPKQFQAGFLLPQIWSINYITNTAIVCPGNQGIIYQWTRSATTAPVKITNSPPANYVFVAEAEGILVALGADNVPNKIRSSDNLDITNWTPDATSNAYNANVEGAGRFIAHSYVKGQYLLFTPNAVYTMIYVGKPDIWVIRLLTDTDGLIGPNAVMEIPDAVAWQGQNDFYIYNGSVVSQIPNNTLLHWMIDNINWHYSYLCFARKVIEFNEVWWYFVANNYPIIPPFSPVVEPNTYIIWNYMEGHVTNGQMVRTAAEKPTNPTRAQYMAVGTCDQSIPTKLYQHEVDFSDNGQPMTGSLTTNYNLFETGDFVQQISQIIPSNLVLPIGSLDTNQHLYTLTVNTKEYDGQADARTFGPYEVFGNTTKIDTRITGRQRQYMYDFSNTIGFRIQKTYEMQKPYGVR